MSIILAREICSELLDENTSSVRKAYLLGKIATREVTIDQILGFREEIFSRAKIIELVDNKVDYTLGDIIDVCGTGGDGKDSFNISTCVAFVLSSLKIKVVKHGNAASSSTFGSSDILKALGISLTDDTLLLKKQLKENNICFLHAPLFHPCLKVLAPIRKELKEKTIFNVLGPLLNPSNNKNQITGVANASIYRKYLSVLKELNKNYYVLFSRDGYDEISLTDSFYIGGKKVNQFFDINDFKIDGRALKVSPKQIEAKKSIEESVILVEEILKGEASEHYLDVVSINAGAGISLLKNVSLVDGFVYAKKALKKGLPYEILNNLRLYNKEE